MSEKPVKPIPTAGSWIQNVNERAILYVSEVNPVKERIQIKRFAGYVAEGPEFSGRTTWLSYETYRRGSRYMPREAPVNPDNLPERITREQAQEALELEGWSTTAAFEALDDAARRADDVIGRPSAILRAYLGKPAPAVTPPDGMSVTPIEDAKIVNLNDAPETSCMHTAQPMREDAALQLWTMGFSDVESASLLDSPQAPLIQRILAAKIAREPVNVLAAQPTIADVLAAIEALRAEVRADRKPLLDAVDRVLASIEDGSALGVTRRAVALDDLRAARAKV